MLDFLPADEKELRCRILRETRDRLRGGKSNVNSSDLAESLEVEKQDVVEQFRLMGPKADEGQKLVRSTGSLHIGGRSASITGIRSAGYRFLKEECGERDGGEWVAFQFRRGATFIRDLGPYLLVILLMGLLALWWFGLVTLETVIQLWP